MTKEGIKHKTISKKSNVPGSNVAFDTFLKNQQIIVSRLKTELKSVISKVQLSDNGTMEQHKIFELEQSISQRDDEVQKLSAKLDQLKEENSKTLSDFHYFKEKFYHLETSYDSALNQQIQENEHLRAELQNLQITHNKEIQKLSVKHEDLQQTLQEKINDLTQLNKLHDEILQNFEQLKNNFERQHDEFEIYKKQVSEEKGKAEISKLEFENLKDDLRKKDEIIRQCISDKNVLEKEKNLTIAELNNKICRIERAFTQPTTVAQPMRQKVNSSDNISSSECSIENMATSTPLARKPLENISVQSLSNIENQNVEQNQKQRDYKFKRPAQLNSMKESNIVTNRKRRNQPIRKHSGVTNYNEFSSSSSDEGDVKVQLWRPNIESYVADTDESGGFFKSKRSKK